MDVVACYYPSVECFFHVHVLWLLVAESALDTYRLWLALLSYFKNKSNKSIGCVVIFFNFLSRFAQKAGKT